MFCSIVCFFVGLFLTPRGDIDRYKGADMDKNHFILAFSICYIRTRGSCFVLPSLFLAINASRLTLLACASLFSPRYVCT